MPTYPLSKLKARVNLGVQRSDIALASNGYADFINTGIKELEDLKSWKCMATQANVTILAGQKSVAMPAGFKELDARNTNGGPVAFVLDDPNNPGAVFPVSAYFEAQELRRFFIFGGQLAISFGEMRVFLKSDKNGTTLGMVQPAVENLTFRVDYYGYLPDLVDETDVSPLAEAYPEMVIAKAKALALASVNDVAAAGAEGFAAGKFKEASFAEARAALQGRDLRM